MFWYNQVSENDLYRLFANEEVWSPMLEYRIEKKISGISVIIIVLEKILENESKVSYLKVFIQR